MDEGRLRAHPLRVDRGGFAAVLDGVEELKGGGKISGQKLVYCLK